MTVNELKEALNDVNGDLNVAICVETPDGWVAPQGSTCDVDMFSIGFDWLDGDFLLIPKHPLKVVDRI